MLLCCELRLTLASSRFDDTLHPPSTCEVAHGRDAGEIVADLGARLQDLISAPTRIDRADEDPEELGLIEVDYNCVVDLIHQEVGLSLQKDKTESTHDLDLELDDEVWNLQCKVYQVKEAS